MSHPFLKSLDYLGDEPPPSTETVPSPTLVFQFKEEEKIREEVLSWFKEEVRTAHNTEAPSHHDAFSFGCRAQ